MFLTFKEKFFPPIRGILFEFLFLRELVSEKEKIYKKSNVLKVIWINAVIKKTSPLIFLSVVSSQMCPAFQFLQIKEKDMKSQDCHV